MILRCEVLEFIDDLLESFVFEVHRHICLERQELLRQLIEHKDVLHLIVHDETGQRHLLICRSNRGDEGSKRIILQRKKSL